MSPFLKKKENTKTLQEDVVFVSFDFQIQKELILKFEVCGFKFVKSELFVLKGIILMQISNPLTQGRF